MQRLVTHNYKICNDIKTVTSSPWAVTLSWHVDLQTQ